MINRSLNEDEIYNITEAFRMAILDAKYDRRFQYRDRMSNFPGGCCDDASDLLAYYLLEKYNIHTEQGNGVYRDDNPEHTTNHAWLIVNGESYIDITATQFMFCGAFKKDIYVGKSFYFYEELEDVKIYRIAILHGINVYGKIIKLLWSICRMICNNLGLIFRFE